MGDMFSLLVNMMGWRLQVDDTVPCVELAAWVSHDESQEMAIG